MNFQLVKPTGFLKNYINHYCFMESPIQGIDVTERVIPSESIQLMFHYRNPFVTHYQNGLLVVQPRSVVSGLSNTYSDVSTSGEAGVVFVTFYPHSACHFFPFPLSEIANKSINMADIFHQETKQVEEKLYLKNSVHARVQVIEDLLIRKFSPIPPYDYQTLQKGMEYIRLLKGQTTVKTLSEKLSTTPKTLERKFSRYLGKTTKQMIKLIRFQEVISGLSTESKMTLTEQAYRNGYFDQAHFIKDFKTYCGYTPREYLVKYSSPVSDIN